MPAKKCLYCFSHCCSIASTWFCILKMPLCVTCLVDLPDFVMVILTYEEIVGWEIGGDVDVPIRYTMVDHYCMQCWHLRKAISNGGGWGHVSHQDVVKNIDDKINNHELSLGMLLTSCYFFNVCVHAIKNIVATSMHHLLDFTLTMFHCCTRRSVQCCSSHCGATSLKH